MYSRLFLSLAAVGTLTSLTGCVQATRHSNTMVFGTNTTFGIKVGTTTGEVPEIIVGYDRQEAVIMPLVANTVDNSTSPSNRLKPCDLTQSVTVNGTSDFAVHPCSLVAVNGKALDSYSVLASFGAQYDAGTRGAAGGLAQYFATGVAAQLLAATGGASVVATGPAATASALNAPPIQETIDSLYGDSAAFGFGRKAVALFDAFMTQLLAKIDRTPADALVANVAAFETAADAPIKISASCSDKVVCKAAARDAYAVAYRGNQTGFDTALAAWTVQ